MVVGIEALRKANAGPLRLRSGQAFDSPSIRSGSLRMTSKSKGNSNRRSFDYGRPPRRTTFAEDDK
jgi:hypothetical protein